MGCSSCGSGGSSMMFGPQRSIKAAPIANENCPYTEEQLEQWRLTLLCVRDQNLRVELGISEAQLNGAVGIVVSGINYRWNICYFQKELDGIAPLIVQIINSGKCQ